MDVLLEKKSVKVFCVYIIPIVIGILFPAVIDMWGQKNIKFYFLLGVAILLGIVYIYTSYKYIKRGKDNKERIKTLRRNLRDAEKEIDGLRKKIDSFEKGMRELATLFVDSSEGINKTANNILQGKLTFDLWNFKKVSTGICNSVYALLCELCKPCDDFTVNIVLADSTAQGKRRNITMIAYKGKYEKYPNTFGKKMYFDKHSTFYAVKVCKSNNINTRVLTTKEEINENFVYVDEDHPDYSQYVGIPIVCSGKKIICLLQICAFGNDKIADTKADILKIVMGYLYPFTNYALLAYKIEKGLISSFSTIEKSRKGEDWNA